MSLLRRVLEASMGGTLVVDEADAEVEEIFRMRNVPPCLSCGIQKRRTAVRGIRKKRHSEKSVDGTKHSSAKGKEEWVDFSSLSLA